MDLHSSLAVDREVINIYINNIYIIYQFVISREESSKDEDRAFKGMRTYLQF